jgi:hypothetical protein
MARWPQKFRLTALIVVLVSTSSLAVGCSPSTPPSTLTQFSYQVRVQAGDTGECIQDAIVTIDVEGQAPLDSITDSKGVARIFISTAHAGQPGFLIVEAEGYEKYTQHIDLIVDTLPDVVQIKRSFAVVPTSTFTPSPTHIGPSTGAPTPTFTTIATTTPTFTPVFIHTPTRTEIPTDTPVFTRTPARTETPTATLPATNAPTLKPTPTLSYTIEFRASKTIVSPGEWVTFRWCVKNVQAVYLDWKGGVGAPGEGWDSRQMWETTDPDHTLRVVLKNGETVTRTIIINVTAP